MGAAPQIGPSSGQTFFSKIIEEHNYKRILARVESDRTIVTCKIETDSALGTAPATEDILQIVKLKVRRFRENVCYADFVEGIKAQSSHPVIVTFDLGDEKFFMKTVLFPKAEGLYCFDFTAELFKLQRRDNFRVKLPSDIKLFVVIKKIGEQNYNKKFQVGDLSAGGCSFDAGSDQVARFAGLAQMEIELYLPRNVIFKLKAQSKSTRKSSAGTGRRIGIQFLNLAEQDKQVLVSVVMELHRTLFSRIR